MRRCWRESTTPPRPLRRTTASPQTTVGRAVVHRTQRDHLERWPQAHGVVISDRDLHRERKCPVFKSGRRSRPTSSSPRPVPDIQVLGGMRLIVDSAEYQLPEGQPYKVLLKKRPSLAWIIGYTNASWTTESTSPAPTCAGCCGYGRQQLQWQRRTRVRRTVRWLVWHVRPTLNSGYEARPGHHMPRQGSSTSVGGAHALQRRTDHSKTPSMTACCASPQRPKITRRHRSANLRKNVIRSVLRGARPLFRFRHG